MPDETAVSESTLDKLKGASDFEDMTVQRMSLTELSPAEYNPRKISSKSFKALGASIDKFGVLLPIVWNKRTGNIVGGHQRFRYLVEEGVGETDVVVVDLDPQEEIALNITLNSKELRGQFTEDAVRLLKLTEARIGSVFGEMALVDLHNALVKKLKTPKKSTTDDIPPGGPDDEDGEPVAVITCPSCRSRWRMGNNEVVYDATKQTESFDG